MFKMGCSKAKKILALDGGKNQQANEQTAKKGQKPDKQQQQLSPGVSKRPTGEELNDFSKLQDDPRIPLNVRQIFKITKSWKAIARTMSKTGTAMFLNLFEQNRDLFYLFDRFQHLKGEELHESMELREHAATVMSTLDQSINSLSDYDNFVTYLHSIGELHRKVPGFRRLHFWKIEQPFLKAVKQTLDERCNETIEEIYKIAIKLIIETIAEGYGEDSSQPDSGPSSNRGASNGDGSGPGAGPSDAGDGKHHQSGSSNSSAKEQTSDNLKSSQPTSCPRMQVAATTSTTTSGAGHNLECRSGGVGELSGATRGAGSGSEQARIKLASIYPLSAHSGSSSAKPPASSLSSSTTLWRATAAARYMMQQPAEVGPNMGPDHRQLGGCESRRVSSNSRTAMQLKRSLFVLKQLLGGSRVPLLAVARRRSFRNTTAAGELVADDEARSRRWRRDVEEQEEQEEEEERGVERELAVGQEPQRVGAPPPPPSGRLINCPARYGKGGTRQSERHGCERRSVAPRGRQLEAASGAARKDPPTPRRTRKAAWCGRCSASSPFWWRSVPEAGAGPHTGHKEQPASERRSCNANERRPNETLAGDEPQLSKLMPASSPTEQFLSATQCSCLAPGSGALKEGLLAGYSQATHGAPMRQVGAAERSQSGPCSAHHSRLVASACQADDEQMCRCSQGIRTQLQQQSQDEGAHLSGTREPAVGPRRRQCWAKAAPATTRVKQSSRGHSILMSLQRLAALTQVGSEQQQQQQASNAPSSSPAPDRHKPPLNGRARGVDLGDVSELIKALMQALSVAQRDLAAPLPVLA